MKTLREAMEDVQTLKKRGLEHHGSDFYDHPIYDELLALEEKIRQEMYKQDDAKVTQPKSRWD